MCCLHTYASTRVKRKSFYRKSELQMFLLISSGQTVHRYGVSVVVNFLSQVIFVFLLFLGMIMYANEVETKEK